MRIFIRRTVEHTGGEMQNGQVPAPGAGELLASPPLTFDPWKFRNLVPFSLLLGLDQWNWAPPHPPLSPTGEIFRWVGGRELILGGLLGHGARFFFGVV